MTKTYTEFAAEHAGMHLWDCDANPDEQGRPMLDVLVYRTREDLDADTDNSLAIARATVIDDRGGLIRPVKGRRYDTNRLRFLGWTGGDGSSTEGYSCWTYFDRDGMYLGPDEFGIEPEFEAA